MYKNGKRIINIDPLDRESKKMIFHYTSPDGLMLILKSHSLRFTDCQFLNDKSEYTNIREPLTMACKKIKNQLNDKNLIFYLDELINKKYNYETVINFNDRKLGGFKSITMRYYIFSCSRDSDSLNMWNYYIKRGAYQGYNIGFSINDLLSGFSKIKDKNVCIFYGPIIYKNRIKIDILKNLIKRTDEELFSNSQSQLDVFKKDIRANEIIANMLSDIENYRLFFKDSFFSNEHEYRFAIRLPIDYKPKYEEKLELNFYLRNGILTPFCDLKFNDKEVVNEINISPMLDYDLAREGIEQYLSSHNYSENIGIHVSRIPVRF